MNDPFFFFQHSSSRSSSWHHSLFLTDAPLSFTADSSMMSCEGWGQADTSLSDIQIIWFFFHSNMILTWVVYQRGSQYKTWKVQIIFDQSAQKRTNLGTAFVMGSEYSIYNRRSICLYKVWSGQPLFSRICTC